ncbi:MAG: bifunctional UDP-N-acetylglucosamine diphosphorylase/glucosamine-1-phosphate N-acetyltransferase GlmU, partial [Chloroflexota bacterium]
MSRSSPLAVLVLAAPAPTCFGSARPVSLHAAAGRTLLDRVLETALAAAASEPGSQVVVAGPAEVLESARSRLPSLRTLLVEGPCPAADAAAAAEAAEAAFGADLPGLRVLVLRAESPLLSPASVLAAVPASPGLAVASGELVPADEALRVTTRRELAAAEAVLRARAAARAMDAGATLVRPETVTLDDTVELEADCVVGPYATLSGATSVGALSRIGQGCVVVDSRIGRGVEVRPYCVIENAVVGDGAFVGPFARLREGTDLGPAVHVGNFVETKKARLARGAKANHLTYLGDVDVGEGTNVGAGVITCNYDGVFKHRTTIGAK